MRAPGRKHAARLGEGVDDDRPDYDWHTVNTRDLPGLMWSERSVLAPSAAMHHDGRAHQEATMTTSATRPDSPVTVNERARRNQRQLALHGTVVLLIGLLAG